MRDRGANGRFVVGVGSTGIGCRPNCPARRPERAEASFHADPVAAEAAGYVPHHFHRLFTRATGIAPTAYRRTAAMPGAEEPKREHALLARETDPAKTED